MSLQATEESKPSGSPAPPPDEPRIGVSGTQVAASVLASVSAAVVASFFGVAGTIVGAAVVSVVATVGSAAYGLGLRRTQARLQQVQVLRIARPLARPPADGDATAAEAEAETGSGPGRLRAPVPVADRRWAWLSQRRWGLAAGVAIVLVISLATVSLVELARNRPLSGGSSGTRDTSLGQLFGGDDGRDTGDGGHDPGTSPTTAAPTDSPSTTAPAGGSAGRSTTATDGSSSTTTSSTAPPATSTTVVPTTSPTTVPTTVAAPGGLTDRTG